MPSVTLTNSSDGHAPLRPSLGMPRAPRRRQRPVEPAKHRRARQMRSQARTMLRAVGAGPLSEAQIMKLRHAARMLEDHHGSAIPRSAQQYLAKIDAGEGIAEAAGHAVSPEPPVDFAKLYEVKFESLSAHFTIQLQIMERHFTEVVEARLAALQMSVDRFISGENADVFTHADEPDKRKTEDATTQGFMKPAPSAMEPLTERQKIMIQEQIDAGAGFDFDAVPPDELQQFLEFLDAEQGQGNDTVDQSMLDLSDANFEQDIHQAKRRIRALQVDVRELKIDLKIDIHCLDYAIAILKKPRPTQQLERPKWYSVLEHCRQDERFKWMLLS